MMSAYRVLALVALTVILAADLAASEHAGIVMFGAVPVPGATITATRGDLRVSTVSDVDGSYRFDDLEDGDWTVVIEMIGFETARDVVSVTANMAPRSWTLAMRPFDELRADGQLVPMAPSAASRAPATPTARDAAAPAANPETASGDAAYAAAESLLVNGSVNNGAASPFAQLAAFGNNRRGQRRLYNGGLGLIAGTSAWDARPFSFTARQTPKPDYTDVQLLGTFGGPVRLPKFRNGPTVFAGYQRSSDHAAATQSVRVPTPLERAGDFSQSRDAFGNAVTVRDPLTGRPFAGNVIPRDRLSPQALSLLQYYPQGDAGANGYNFQAPSVTATHQDNMQFRANQSLGRRDSLFGNALYARTVTDSTDVLGYTDSATATSSDFAVNWARRLSQFSTLRLRYQRQGQANSATPYFSGRSNVSGAAGITGNNQDSVNWGPPRLVFSSGLIGLGSPSWADNHARTDSWSAEALRVVGRHNLTIGGGTGVQHVDVLSQQDARGTFSFTGASSGWDVADFLLGLPATSAIAFGNADKQLRGTTAQAYVNDDWRVSPTLTINGGVRWEYESPLNEEGGRLSNLLASSDFTSLERVTPGSSTAQAARIPDALLRADRRGVQPRVGVAWRPIAGSSLVVRGGYGIYRNTGIYQSLSLLLAQQPPFSTTFSLASTAARQLTLADGFAKAAASAANTFAIDPDFRVGSAHNWQLSAQRDLPGSLTVVGTYRGTHGAHLMQEFLPNTYPSGTNRACIECSSGFVYLTSNGSSRRHAGQVQLRRRLRNGLMASVDYTLATATDNASAFVPVGNPLESGASATSTTGASTGVAGAVIAQDWLDLDAERSRSSFDQRHSLSVQVQYTTGMGVTGGALLDGVRGRLFKGWTVTGQATWGSGLPLTPIVLAPVSGTGVTGTIRASLTGASVTPAPGYYFNPAAYAAPAPGEWGSAGRNSVNGPSQFALNAGLGRSFLWGERVTLDWRLDATNALNTVVYSGVDTNVGSPQFGQPNRANPMRKLQTSLRMRF
jgi:hypothetical protein